MAKSQASWSDVKAKLESLDRQQLLGLIKDLYGARKDNQVFLHSRFGIGTNVLKSYKDIIDRWLWPDVVRGQNTSVAKAKQAVADYKKAVGDTAGVAELMVFYCERTAGFSNTFGTGSDSELNAVANMFESALAVIDTLPEDSQQALMDRLEQVRRVCDDFGFDVD